jgi:ABC-type transport system involved in cytochrome bd biosynthesis fused ATPase/permease subunit
MIDFTLSESQNAIRTKAANFSKNVLSTAAATYEKHPTQVERFRALRPFYRQAVEAGLIRGLIAKGAGGDAGTLGKHYALHFLSLLFLVKAMFELLEKFRLPHRGLGS